MSPSNFTCPGPAKMSAVCNVAGVYSENANGLLLPGNPPGAS